MWSCVMNRIWCDSTIHCEKTHGCCKRNSRFEAIVAYLVYKSGNDIIRTDFFCHSEQNISILLKNNVYLIFQEDLFFQRARTLRPNVIYNHIAKHEVLLPIHEFNISYTNKVSIFTKTFLLMNRKVCSIFNTKPPTLHSLAVDAICRYVIQMHMCTMRAHWKCVEIIDIFQPYLQPILQETEDFFLRNATTYSEIADRYVQMKSYLSFGNQYQILTHQMNINQEFII